MRQFENMGWKHPAWVLVGHEIWHAWDHYLLGDEMLENLSKYFGRGETYRIQYIEARAVKFQNYLFSGGNAWATNQNTQGLRTHYSNFDIGKKSEFISYLPEINTFYDRIDVTPKSNLDNLQFIMNSILIPKKDDNCGCK